VKFELCPISADQRTYIPPDSDFVELLGGKRNPSEESLKKAFRHIAKIIHPDTNGGSEESERLFAELNAAYEMLSDPEKRSAYHSASIEEKVAAEAYESYFGSQADMAPGVHVVEGQMRW
jgi:DnaJ-class molecular chaperone